MDVSAPRLNGLFGALRGFIAERASRRWAEQQAPVPWEVRFRTAIASAAAIAALIVACLLGALALVMRLAAVTMARDPGPGSKTAGRFGSNVVGHLAGSASVAPPTLSRDRTGCNLAAARCGELFLISWSQHPRDQFFVRRVPLHIAVILRYGAFVFLAGAVLLALISEMGKPAGAVEYSMLHLILLFVLLVVLAGLQYLATSLKISVELKKLNQARELAASVARSCQVCDGDYRRLLHPYRQPLRAFGA